MYKFRHIKNETTIRPIPLSIITCYSENVSCCWSYIFWETSCRKWDDDFTYTDRCFKQKLVRPLVFKIWKTDLPGSYLDVEVAPLIWDFEDLRPGKAVDPEPVPVNEKAIGTDTQHYFDPFWILQRDNLASIVKEHTWRPCSCTLKETQPDLSMMEVNSIHGQFLCILQKVNFSLCWSHPPVGRRKFLSLIHHSRAVSNQSMIFGQRGSNCYSDSIIHFSVPPRAAHVPKRNAKSERGKNRQMVLKYGGIYQV